ncbi:uncharacterized protein LOC120106116 [Phoenix dactylifera]|uniref:Uncharacterized protein LOC120106116 n=1 Tax=Phoenix dactylifera TaxID=42345 RepID=A0A8B8ZL60_PHODC|nr:uncharacterized protein LOC120106116 [Phoenix dactylifera]
MQVDVECAWLQHRLSMPPLEVDYQQLDLSEPKILQSGRLRGNTKKVDNLQEIQSIASASQELVNNASYTDIWAGSCSQFDEFSSLLEFGKSQQSLIEISDLEEEFKDKKRKENLKGVKILSNEIIEIALTEQQSTPIESIPSHQVKENADAEGEANLYTNSPDKGGIGNKPIFSQVQPDDFALGFIHPLEVYQQDHDNNAYATEPAIDVYEKVEVKHGLFVSSGGAAETFFLHVEPLKKVRFHLNPMVRQDMAERNEFPTKDRGRFSFFGSFKAFIEENTQKMTGKISMKALRRSFIGDKTVFGMLQILAVLLTSCIYFGEVSDQANLRKQIFSMDHPMKGEREGRYLDGPKKAKEGEDNIWFLNVRGKSISSTFLNGK